MKADFLRYHIEDLLSFLFENKITKKYIKLALNY